jgi:putative Ca2+/H+ antiporter (TMEM165/GDT1 family)
VNLVVFGAVFGIIFVGELPDKTMIASLVLASRGRPAAVWLGAAAAFTLHVVIATTLGTLVFHLLSRRAVNVVVAVIFLAGAILAIIEAVRERQRLAAAAAAPPGPPRGPGRTLITAFAVIFAAEWGDLTQILTANLAAHYRAPLSVGLGALLALWAVCAIAVTGGRWLGRVLDAVVLRLATAALLTGLAAYTTWIALS